MPKKPSWREAAWEKLLREIWDSRTGGTDSVEYDKQVLHPILRKYTKSGQGEIRIFNSGSNRLEPLKKRGIAKIPLTRSRWKLVKSSPPLEFLRPVEGGLFSPINELTPGMKAGIIETMGKKSNPGETTLLAIANHVGILSDFYSLAEKGILFTGGRQKAAAKIEIAGGTDVSKAQIEIDGGFEWDTDVVIAEVKSSFSQPDFDLNQAYIPTLKWETLLPKKKVHALVLLGETNVKGIEYWAFNLEFDVSQGVITTSITRSKRYEIVVKEKE